MSKTKLRPCPFCGGDEIEISSEDGATKAFYRAYCEVCSSAGSFSKSRAAAIRAWNDRPGNTINDQIGCLADIRRVVGDPEGKLMQDELVECIAKLVADAELGRAVRKMPEGAGLYHMQPEVSGDGWCAKERDFTNRGNTPKAALRAAGLMEEEK